MGAYFDKGRGGWRFSFFYHSDRHQSPRVFETKRDALDAESILRRSLTRRAAGLEVDPAALPPAPRFEEWAGVYMHYVQEQAQHGRVKRPDVIEGNLRVVLRFFGPRPDTVDPDAYKPDYETPYHDLRLDDPIEDPGWLRKFEDWLAKRKVSGSTRNHYLNALSRLYWLAQHPEYRHLAPGVGTNPFSYRPRTRWQRRTAKVTPVGSGQLSIIMQAGAVFLHIHASRATLSLCGLSSSRCRKPLLETASSIGEHVAEHLLHVRGRDRQHSVLNLPL